VFAIAALGGAAALCRVGLAFRVALDVDQSLLEAYAQGEGEVLVGDGEITWVRSGGQVATARRRIGDAARGDEVGESVAVHVHIVDQPKAGCDAERGAQRADAERQLGAGCGDADAVDGPA